MVNEPEVDVPPPPVDVQEVALVDVQFMVAVDPEVIDEAEVEIDTVGAGVCCCCCCGVSDTRTVEDWEIAPPAPEQSRL